MKNLLKKSVVLSLVASSLLAGSWEDVLAGLDPNQEVKSGSWQTGISLYDSQISYFIADGDGDTTNFSSSDTGRIMIYDTSGKLLLDSNDYNGGNLTSDEMEDWARANASEIMSAIFSDDPAQSVSGQNNAITTSYLILDTVANIEDTAQINKKGSFKQDTASQSISMLGSEKIMIKDGSTDVTGSSTVISFSSTSTSANSAGMLINYKTLSADDNLDSNTKHLLVTPYYKIDGGVNEKLNIPVVLSLSANIVYLESTIFPDGVGYFEYGGAIGVLPSYKPLDNLTLKANLGYNYVKKYIPESYVPEDAKWLSDAINDLKPLQVASYGAGIKYDVLKNWIVIADVLQTKHLETQSIKEGREVATYYAVSSSYSWTDWTMRLGYKTVKDLEDYEEDAYMVSFGYSW